MMMSGMISLPGVKGSAAWYRGPMRVNNTHSRTYAPRDRRCHDVVPMSPARPDEMAANRKSVYGGTVDGSRGEYIVRARMVPRQVNWKFTDVSTW